MIREFYKAQEGKAFPYVTELTDAGGPLIGPGIGAYGAYNPYTAGDVPYGRVQTPMSQRESGVHSQVYGGSEPVDWLMDAVGYIVQTASESQFHFEDDAGKELVLKKSDKDPADISEVPFLLKKLFDEPNPYQDWQEFIELALIDFLLLGNAYWVKFKQNASKQPAALYRMVPAYVQIIPDKFGPAKYLYKLPMQPEPVEFDRSEVLHFRRSNPNNPYFGVGIVKGGARPIDMELALTDTTARYYEQQTLPSGTVETERRVPRDVFNKLKAQLQSFYGGSRNAGRLMVLEAGLKFTAISPNAMDAGFQQLGAWSRDRILSMFNMNKVLIGIAPESGDPAIDAWQRVFDQKTMIPLLNKFGRAVSRGLTQPGWGLDLKFDYEETQAPADVINRATMFAKLPGVKVHELRDAAGLPPSTGDTEVDNMVLNLPGPNLDATGQGGFPDRNLPGEPGRPPLPQNTRPIASAGPAGRPGAARVIATNKKAMDVVNDTLDHISMRKHVLEGKALAPARTHVGEIDAAIPPEDTLHSTRTVAIDNLVQSMTRELQEAVHTLERGLLDAAEGKAAGTTYQRIKNSKAWSAFRARLSDILQSGAEQGVSLANIQHAKVGHLPNMEMDYADLAKQQVYRPEGVLGIVKTLKDRILKDVLAIQRQGANPGEFNKALLEAVSNWRDKQAETIALTEASLAYNEGTFQVAEANDKEHVLVSDGLDFDEPCREANGAIWTIDEARAHSLEHPRCRRAFVPVGAPAA